MGCHFPTRLIGRVVPVLAWLPGYKWKSCFLADLICGMIVGTMQIAQSMAYAILAGLHPVHGLYTSFFANLLYFVFGTSRHISFGTFAVVSLMSRVVHIRYVPLVAPANFTSEEEFYFRSDVASALTFVVGILQLIFGLLQFGFLQRCLSDQVIGGFTLGVAVHIFISQLFTVFDIKMLSHNVPWNLFLEIKGLITGLPKCNIATAGCSAIALLFLVFMNSCCKRCLAHHCRHPFPSELALLLFGICVFYFTPMASSYGIKLIGPLPSGLPQVRTPPLHIVPNILPDALCIAVVSYSSSISMARMLARKYGYQIDADQEWRAYGISHVVSSFFGCNVASASLTRSLVQSESGGKSQIASVFSAIVVASALFFCGPIFAILPRFILASVVIFALKGMTREAKRVPMLWRTSSGELAVWMVSFMSTVAFNVTWGLMISILFNFILFVWKLRRPVYTISGKYIQAGKICDGRTLCRDVQVYTIRFIGLICFLNGDVYKKILMNGCSFRDQGGNDAYAKAHNDFLDALPLLAESFSKEPVPSAKTIAIVDGSRMAVLDASSVEEIREAILYLSQGGVRVFLCNFSDDSAKLLRIFGCEDVDGTFCLPYDEALSVVLNAECLI